jgi:16S rRNA (cytosine1402-N4)-methyltransferase
VPHIPVLLHEVVAALAPRKGAVVVDCTIGLGGHAAALLERIGKKGLLIGLDLDLANLETARSALHGNVILKHTNFAALPSILAEAGVEKADAILADLGVASPHLDEPTRGFSYRRDGPLDMRLDLTRGESASALLDRLSEQDIAAALRDLGNEEDAEPIAALIVKRRPIATTNQLMELVCQARHFTVDRAFGAKLHPATRTFQALRMLVNRELPNLERLLAVTPSCLAPGGTIAIIAFHSGEDRIVKRAFRDGPYATWSRDPVTPSEAERTANPRSRSAKLRWARLPR